MGKGGRIDCGPTLQVYCSGGYYPKEHEKAGGQQHVPIEDSGEVVRGKGFGKLCPRDGKMDCAVVDALDGEGKAGRANLFLSWVWSYKLDMWIQVIE